MYVYMRIYEREEEDRRRMRGGEGRRRGEEGRVSGDRRNPGENGANLHAIVL